MSRFKLGDIIFDMYCKNKFDPINQKKVVNVTKYDYHLESILDKKVDLYDREAANNLFNVFKRNSENQYQKDINELALDILFPKQEVSKSINPMYCSCNSDNVVDAWAGGEKYKYCRGCRKERI